jgi:dimethylamine corrinoid protein
MPSKKEIVRGLTAAVLTCNREEIVDAAKAALAAGIDPQVAIEGLMPGIESLESRFAQKKISMPALTATEYAVREAREILLSKTPDGHPLKQKVKVVIGIVAGDPHSIGKSISVAMLASRGFEVYDLGEDVPAVKFVEKAQEVHAEVIAVGTLVLACMRHQKDVIDILNEKGLRDSHKVVVCGRTEIITPEFAEEIGSDACGVDINDLVVKVQKLAHSEDSIDP